MTSSYPGLVREWYSEFIGTGLIVMAVVGSAFMASELSDDALLQLLVNAVATMLILALVISLFASISGAHFNPVVTLVFAVSGRIAPGKIPLYQSAQFTGGFVGVVLANLMFTGEFVELSSKNRSLAGNYLGELIATSILIFIIMLALSEGKDSAVPLLVPAWIGSAYFLTVSTSFANPAVTLSRAFTSNFSGINLQSTFGFIAVQLVGGALGLGLFRILSRR